MRYVRELRPLLHGEYQVVLSDGTELTSGRSYRAAIQAMFGLGLICFNLPALPAGIPDGQVTARLGPPERDR